MSLLVELPMWKCFKFNCSPHNCVTQGRSNINKFFKNITFETNKGVVEVLKLSTKRYHHKDTIDQASNLSRKHGLQHIAQVSPKFQLILSK